MQNKLQAPRLPSEFMAAYNREHGLLTYDLIERSLALYSDTYTSFVYDTDPSHPHNLDGRLNRILTARNKYNLDLAYITPDHLFVYTTTQAVPMKRFQYLVPEIVTVLSAPKKTGDLWNDVEYRKDLVFVPNAWHLFDPDTKRLLLVPAEVSWFCPWAYENRVAGYTYPQECQYHTLCANCERNLHHIPGEIIMPGALTQNNILTCDSCGQELI